MKHPIPVAATLLFFAGFVAPNRIYAIVAPPYVSDTELAEKPVIVVAHWGKSAMQVHERTRTEEGVGRVLDKFEVHTELIIDRVIKGDLSPGTRKLLIGYGIGWSEDGRDVRTYTSTEMLGDVDDVTKPALWFLTYTRSWDETDPTTYLHLDTYRGIQPLALEPYYRILMRPDREQAIGDLLDSPDKAVGWRCLHFIHAEHDPWPFADYFDEFNHPPYPKDKPLIQHAERISHLLDNPDAPNRPYAAAVYASLRGRASLEKMREWFADKDPVVRAIAVGVLARYRDGKSVDRFLSALTDFGEGGVGCAVIERLAEWGDIRLVPALISFLQTDSYLGADWR